MAPIGWGNELLRLYMVWGNPHLMSLILNEAQFHCLNIVSGWDPSKLLVYAVLAPHVTVLHAQDVWSWASRGEGVSHIDRENGSMCVTYMTSCQSLLVRLYIWFYTISSHEPNLGPSFSFLTLTIVTMPSLKSNQNPSCWLWYVLHNSFGIMHLVLLFFWLCSAACF